MSQVGRRTSALSQVGAQMFSAGLDPEHLSEKRMMEQQAHHKELLHKRLSQKRGGRLKAGNNQESNPDHPDNVRRRELERQKQERMAQKRLELKRREQQKKLQLRREHRKAANQQESFTVVKDGKIMGGQDLTPGERRAKLKARQELQRRQRREEAEANHNPFDPASKLVRQGSADIWDTEDADAMIASAGMLHEINAASRAHQRKLSGTSTDFDDDEFADLYSFTDPQQDSNTNKSKSPVSKSRLMSYGSSSVAASPENSRPPTGGSISQMSSRTSQSSIEADDIENLLSEIM